MHHFVRAHLQASTDLSELANVLSWFDQFYDAAIPQTAWLQCQLALAEGFTNAVRHAHQDRDQDTPIEIEVTHVNQSFEIRIWDHGPGFDLEGWVADLPLVVDQEAEGGRGLPLLKRMADVLTYTRLDDQRNCLLIVKKYGATGAN